LAVTSPLLISQPSQHAPIAQHLLIATALSTWLAEESPLDLRASVLAARPQKLSLPIAQEN